MINNDEIEKDDNKMIKSIQNILLKQKLFFKSDKSKDVEYRIEALRRLKASVIKMEDEIILALNKDLGKSEQEGFLTEVQTVYSALNLAIKKTKAWAKPKKVATPLIMTGKSKIIKEPYGMILIIAPFNYPFSLAIEPLIGAISAGNTAIIKPSELTINTAYVIEKIINETFNEEYVSVIQGGINETQELLDSDIDYVFFTGSPKVGRIINERVASKLIPVTMELGGKSPAVFLKSKNLNISAKRLLWGKLMNNGQTCIAPDYILVDEKIKDSLIHALKLNFREMYGEPKDLSCNNDYSRIVNKSHINRLTEIIEKDKKYIVFGGEYDKDKKFLEFTILDIPKEKAKDAASMNEEIFGPILPIISFTKIEEAIKIIQEYPNPLAAYIFSDDGSLKNLLIEQITAGGITVNDTIKHITNDKLPFGGIRTSGIGNYHGKFSFDTFSHSKAVYENKSKFNISMIMPPYTAKKLKFLKKFVK